MTGAKRIAAIIVAAGRGTRAGPGLPKQWRSLRGRTVAAWTLETLRATGEFSRMVLVLNPDDLDLAEGWMKMPDILCTAGGTTRMASVRAGLEALAPDPPDHVLIHDVARPLVTRGLVRRVIDALERDMAAAPALAVTDALWVGHAGRVEGTRDRAHLYRAQTPQGFRYGAILAAHRAAGDDGAADDVAVARGAGLDVAIVPGDEDNLKITTAEDFARAERIMESRMTTTPDIRVGNGFDVHAFEPGDSVTLCGIEVPHDRALKGHSDADVGLHAITDAIYGALAEGDIGQHFPPSDSRWKNAASHIFLEHAGGRASHRGYTVTHVDLTLICELPKIGPHASAMRTRIAAILGLDADRVSVKATTSEGLGFTGRSEGIAAMATVTLVGSA